MRAMMSIAALFPLLAQATPAQPDRIGAICSGSETVRTGAGAPKRLPYRIALGMDLARRVYCYDACGRNQSYPIRAVSGTAVTLADVDGPAQSRHLTFDRATRRLTDVQRITMGPITIDRDARAQCAPAPFHAPFGGKRS